MTSNPPAPCCYQGFKHAGQPTGTLSTLRKSKTNIEIYTSFPADQSTKYGILLLTDVIGHRFQNAQLLADNFAANGYFVLMPDLFDGDAIPLNRPGDFDLQKWLNGAYNPQGKPHLPETVDPIVEACLEEMRGRYGCEKIGAVGYCFGGKYVVRHLRAGKGKVDVGYTAHPSFVDADELREITGPLAIAAAETDVIFPEEKRHETEGILKELGVQYQINLYSGVAHGFAVRGDLSVRGERYALENAFLQAVLWFDEFLRGGSI